MRAILSAALCLALAGCASAPPGMWRPSPVQGAPAPWDVIAASTDADWEEIPAENLMVMDLAGGGQVVILLAPEFAPAHVANIRALARSDGWGRATIYRSVESYVTQWGNNEDPAPLPADVVEQPPAEYDRPLAGLEVRPLPYPDPYASQVGYAAGWGIALDRRLGLAWLPHCFGTVAVARDLAPDTGSGSELYAVIGNAPRYLDRNIANVGQVIEGMSLLSARPAGAGPEGVYGPDQAEAATPIQRVRIVADMPASERPSFERMRTETATFDDYILGLANTGGDFFTQPAGGVDICRARTPVRRKAG